MMGVLFRSILFLLPLAAFAAAKPEGLGFDPTTSNGLEQAASIYIAPENELFYRMRFSNGSYREFDNRDAFSEKPIQQLWSPNGWRGTLQKEKGLILIQSGMDVIGGQAEFLFQHGRLIQFKQGGREYKIPYEKPREPTEGDFPYYFSGDTSSNEMQHTDEGRKGNGISREELRSHESKKGWTGNKLISKRFDLLHIDKDGKGSIVLDMRDNVPEKNK